jgi:hypothetical protein
MERSLKTFAELLPEQRRICLDSFEKFTRMSKEQRDQFLKSAARWQAMTPRERETWRVLVSILPPQPGLSVPPALPQQPVVSGQPVAVSNRSSAGPSE